MNALKYFSAHLTNYSSNFWDPDDCAQKESSESAIGVVLGPNHPCLHRVSASYMGRIVHHYMRLIILCGVYIYYAIII